MLLSRVLWWPPGAPGRTGTSARLGILDLRPSVPGPACGQLGGLTQEALAWVSQAALGWLCSAGGSLEPALPAVCSGF